MSLLRAKSLPPFPRYRIAVSLLTSVVTATLLACRFFDGRSVQVMVAIVGVYSLWDAIRVWRLYRGPTKPRGEDGRRGFPVMPIENRLP